MKPEYTTSILSSFNGAAPAGKPAASHRKTPPFSLRLSEEEREFLDQQAGKQPLGAYIREQLLGDAVRQKRRTVRKPQISDTRYATLLAMLGDSRLSSNHLLKTENEHVEVYEIRGFVSGDLHGAFHEAYAMSKGTKASQFLYSLSLNPPSHAKVSTQEFQEAIGRIEDKLHLTNQPRAIVFHEKEGRRHCHVVWSRIKADEMKAIHLPHTKRKLMEISRDLYIQHGWEMPQGMIDRTRRNSLNMSFGEWQQARRLGKDPRAVKRDFQSAWAECDNRAGFADALKERGYVLAQGDRRGFVALDRHCNVFAVSKWVGIKAKDIRAGLGETQGLPTAQQAREQIAQGMIGQLETFQSRQAQLVAARQALYQSAKSRYDAKPPSGPVGTGRQTIKTRRSGIKRAAGTIPYRL